VAGERRKEAKRRGCGDRKSSGGEGETMCVLLHHGHL